MPVSQPSSFLLWDTNNVNILPIPSSVSQNGWVPGQAVPAEYLNTCFQLLDQWTQWLQQQQSSGGGQTSITSAQTLSTTYSSYFCNPTGGSFNVTLPLSSGVPGQKWTIKNTVFTGSNTVTVVLASNTDVLEGTTNGTQVLNPGESITVQSDGLGHYFEIVP